MSDQTEIFDDVSNPLDSVEDILAGQDWIINRMNADELTVQVAGRLGQYRMVFVWQEEFSAMQFSCQSDLRVSDDRRDIVAAAMTQVNSGLWLGHFDLSPTHGVPCFRHTSLFRGQTQSSGADFVGDLMDIAMAECERFYPLFQMLACAETLDQTLLKLAVQDTAGEA